jgi:hypothetical protein
MSSDNNTSHDPFISVLQINFFVTEFFYSLVYKSIEYPAFTFE